MTSSAQLLSSPRKVTQRDPPTFDAELEVCGTQSSHGIMTATASAPPTPSSTDVEEAVLGRNCPRPTQSLHQKLQPEGPTGNARTEGKKLERRTRPSPSWTGSRRTLKIRLHSLQLRARVPGCARAHVLELLLTCNCTRQCKHQAWEDPARGGHSQHSPTLP